MTWLAAALSVPLIGLLLLAGNLTQREITRDHPGVTLNLDWDTCDDSQWTASGHGALEGGTNPKGQSLNTSRVRRVDHGCAHRFEIRDSPLDVNSGFRAVWARYDSNEGTTGGVDFVYGLSFRVTTVPKYAQIWELHQRANIYRIDPSLSVAPHALLIRDGSLKYREMTGAAAWSGVRWTGWSNYQEEVVIPTCPRTPGTT